MACKNQSNDKRIEVVLWSLALPGFGQLLNGQYFKGAVLLIFEFLINIKSNLNLAIISSFRGDIAASLATTDFQWLMFYPCVYMYAIWDAYRDASASSAPFSFLPFAFTAFTGTIGVIYSQQFKVMGALIGPVWLPIIFMLLGMGIGSFLKLMLVRKS
ncbi:hypothetical protein ACOBQJ_16335 [Pelotomaculum propionicicum]|uniref:hypothetical protein n=1 Tax=Pelotomaculum propionicicum TaxID=258475 RepID=UPI003B766190